MDLKSEPTLESAGALPPPSEPNVPPLDTLMSGLARLNTEALEVIRTRPVACLVGAVTLGFLVGKLATRA
jgi:hypothetical protein